MLETVGVISFIQTFKTMEDAKAHRKSMHEDERDDWIVGVAHDNTQNLYFLLPKGIEALLGFNED